MRTFVILILLSLLSACSTFKPERLNYFEVQPGNKKAPIGYGVYTPPNWQAHERLPLVVFLHGGGGSQYSFERYAADEYLDAEITAGRIPRFILVTPNGDNGFWENWADDSKHYRDWVLKDIVPEVKANYRTLDCPEHCHLAGISMGGFGALRFAYFGMQDFSSVSSISAPIPNREQADKNKPSLLVRLLFPFKRIFGETYTEEFKQSDPYNTWVNSAEQQKMRLQVMWGDEDHKSIIDANKKFRQRLISANVEHDYYVYDGGHKWKYWVPNLGRVMRFLLEPSER